MLRGVNPHPGGRNAKPTSLADFLGSIASLVVLFLAYIVISLLGWWLLVIIPILYCAGFFVWKRKILRAVFSSSENNAVTAQDRSQVRFHFLLLALVFSGLAIALEGSVYACFAASLFWLLTAHLTKAQMDAAKSTKRFVYHLAKASLELLAILTTTLAAYSVFAWRVSALPIDTATLFQIRSWEGTIARVHTFIEAVNLSKLQTIGLIAVLYAGRILEIQYGHGTKAVSYAWGITQLALKWADRIALVAVIAASFTFLATRSDGPPAPLEARLKEMVKDYSQFRSEGQRALAAETKRQLCQRTWNEMPPPLRRALLQTKSIEKEKSGLLDEIRWADSQYHLDGTQSAATEQEYAAELEKEPDQAEQTPENYDAEEHDVDFATAGDLRGAAADASQARSEVLKESVDAKGEMGEELAKDVQGFIVDSDRLADNVGVLKMLTGKYPLLGEFLGTFNDAFNDYIYDRLKPSVKRLIRDKLKAPSQPLLAEIKKASTELAQSAPIHWHPDSAAWRLELDQRVSAEESGIRRALRQLEADAKFAEKRETLRLVGEIRQHESEYQKIGEAVPEHKDLLLQKANIETHLRYLERLPPDSDPLSGFKNPPPSQESAADVLDPDVLAERMKAISSGTDFVGEGQGYRHQAEVFLNSEPSTVLDRLSALNDRCTSQIREIVGKSPLAAKAPLRTALGREAFNKYEREFEGQQENLGRWRNLHMPGRLPGEFGPGFEPRVEPRIEPRIEPHIELVP